MELNPSINTTKKLVIVYNNSITKTRFRFKTSKSMKLSSQIIKFSTAITIIVLTYLLGYISHRKKWFPYHQIEYSKNLIFPPKPNNSQRKRKKNENQPRFSKYYQDKKGIFEEFGKEADVVFLGDSITDYGEWHEIFTDIKVVNRGINGDTTKGVLNRIDSVLQVKPKKVFILIGVNDLLKDEYTNEEILTRYKEIINKSSGKTKVYVQSILFSRGRWSRVNPRVIQLNQELEEYCGQKNIPYIDLNSKLTPDGYLSKEDSLDGIHLSANGFLKWKEVIAPFVYE